MKLQAHKRSSENSDVVRHEGHVPAVCYGPELESAISLQAVEQDIIKVIREAGSSTIVDLDIDGEEHEVLIKDVAYHPVTDRVEHVDFYAIKRGQELEVQVELVFVGESPAEKQGLIVNRNLHDLSVRCLPRNLVNSIEVDISTVAEVSDSITVADLQSQVGETLSILNDAEMAVITVSEAVEEVEESAEESAEAMAEVLADKSEEGGDDSEES